MDQERKERQKRKILDVELRHGWWEWYCMFSPEVVQGDESVAHHSGDKSKFEMSLTTCWAVLFVNATTGKNYLKTNQGSAKRQPRKI